jgi:phenylacetate-CoA ligase
MLSFSVYNKSPIYLQNIACSIYGYVEKRKRFSPEFFKLLEEYRKTDGEDINFIQQYCRARLVEKLSNAVEHSPYYNEINFNADSELDSLELLSQFPILYKEDVRLNLEIIKCSNDRKALQFQTSGTSGKALQFYKTQDAIAAQWAIWFRHRSRFGINLHDVHVNFTGKPLVPQSQLCPPFWRLNSAINQYLVPMQVVTKDKIRSLVEFLNTITPRYYSGYPSILSEVARLALDNGLELNQENKPTHIFPGAEPLLETQRAYLHEWTGAIISEQYGMTEGACNISKCEHDNYHEDFEFGFIERAHELVLDDGAVQAQIVATDFTNNVFPFIRYHTGDTAIWEPDSFRCPCGRSSPVVRSIEGRTEDYIVTPEGRRIMRLDYIFKDSSEIKEAQVVQNKLGVIEILYISRNNEKIDTKKIKSNVAKYISAELIVEFRELSSIPREENGKFRSVKSNLA